MQVVVSRQETLPGAALTAAATDKCDHASTKIGLCLQKTPAARCRGFFEERRAHRFSLVSLIDNQRKSARACVTTARKRRVTTPLRVAVTRPPAARGAGACRPLTAPPIHCARFCARSSSGRRLSCRPEMIIRATRKLAQRLPEVSADPLTDDSPLSSWHADRLTLDHCQIGNSPCPPPERYFRGAIHIQYGRSRPGAIASDRPKQPVK